MALFNEISFSTYARPGELLRLMPEDVVPRNNSFTHDVLILGPIERGQGSKAGIYDETLVLDDTRAAFLGPLMVQLAKRRIKEDKLWDFTAASFLKKWRQAVEIMQISDVAHSPYQNRHGGASRDLMMKLRSLPSNSEKREMGQRCLRKNLRKARKVAAGGEPNKGGDWKLSERM